MKRPEGSSPLLHTIMFWTAIGCAVFCWTKPALSQDESTDDAAPATAPADGDAAEPVSRDRTIYVPFRELKSVFENQNGSVILPYDEYLRLWKNSLDEKNAPAAPQAAVINESHYSAVVEKDLAKIEAKFKVQVLGKPWAQAIVSFPDAAVGKISSKDDKVLLRGLGKGNYALLLPEKGEHEVTLELVTRVLTSPNGRSLAFGCPPVGITTFEITVPESDQTLKIEPKLVTLPADGADANTSKFKASLGATNRIAASWNPRASLKPKMDLLTSVTSYARVQVDPGLVHTDATLVYDILRGELTELQLAIPKGHRILDISAKNGRIKGWKVQDEVQRQLVTVELLSATDSRIEIEAHTEFAITGDAFPVSGITEDGTVQGIHAVGAVRESGQVAVFHGDGLALDVDQQTGVVRMNNKDIAPQLRGDKGLAWRFYSPKLSLSLSARAVEPRITVAQSTLLNFGDDQLNLIATLNFDVTRAGVFELKIKLPDDLKIDQVQSGSMSEFNVDEAADILSIALNEKHLGPLVVTVKAHRDLEPNATPGAEQNVALPILEPQGTARETGTVHVTAPPAIEVVTDEDTLEGAFPSTSNAGYPGQTQRVVSAWEYSRRPVSISVNIARKPTRLTANVATDVMIEPELHSVRSNIQWLVENAGLDTFRFAVPETAQRVQIVAGGNKSGQLIRERSAADPVDGKVVWTVRTQQAMTGNVDLTITWDITPATADDGKVSSTIVPPELLDPTDPVDGDDNPDRVTLARVTGELQVKKDRALSVTAAETGDDIEAIDVRELTRLSRDGFSAYRYYRQPVSLEVTAEKHEIQEVVRTVISRALSEVVVNHDPIGTYLCRYRLTSAERQRLRVDLPQGVELHEPLVDGQKAVLEVNEAADVEDGWESYYVNVARTKSSNEEFVLTLQFRAPIGTEDNRPLTGWGGTQWLRLPVIGGANNPGVVIQQSRVAVWMPKEYASVKTPDDFASERQSMITSLWPVRLGRKISSGDLDQWIGQQNGGIVEFPREGQGYLYSSLGTHDKVMLTWWKLPMYVLWISGALLLIALVLRNASWENKLTLLLIFTLAAALYGLVDSELAVHIVAAAAWGGIGALTIWLVHSMLGWQPTPATATAGAEPSSSGSPPKDFRPVVPVVPPQFDEDEKKPRDSEGKDGGTTNA